MATAAWFWRHPGAQRVLVAASNPGDPRFELAQLERQMVEEQARQEGKPTGVRSLFTDRRCCKADRRLMTWLLFDFVYYGNTISSPVIIKLEPPTLP